MKASCLRKIVVLSQILFAVGTCAQGNLVANGSFERLFEAWQGTYGQFENADFAVHGTTTGVVIDMSHSSVNKTMHQLLSTEPAVPYLLRFWLLSGAGRAGEQSPPGASPVRVRFGDQTLGQFANPSTTTWRMYEFTVTSPSSQTELNFESIGTRWQLIDDISLTVIPEPIVPALFLLGAGLLIIVTRNRSAVAP